MGKTSNLMPPAVVNYICNQYGLNQAERNTIDEIVGKLIEAKGGLERRQNIIQDYLQKNPSCRLPTRKAAWEILKDLITEEKKWGI